MLLASAKLRLGADEAVPALLDQLDQRGAELERAEEAARHDLISFRPAGRCSRRRRQRRSWQKTAIVRRSPMRTTRGPLGGHGPAISTAPAKTCCG